MPAKFGSPRPVPVIIFLAVFYLLCISSTLASLAEFSSFKTADEPLPNTISRPPLLVRLALSLDVAVVTLGDDGSWIDIRITTGIGEPKSQQRLQFAEPISSISASWLADGGFFIVRSKASNGEVTMDRFFSNGTLDAARSQQQIFSSGASELSAATLSSSTTTERILISYTLYATHRGEFKIFEANQANWGLIVTTQAISTNSSTLDAYMQEPNVYSPPGMESSFCFVWIRRLAIGAGYAAPEPVTKCLAHTPSNDTSESDEYVLTPPSFGNYETQAYHSLRLFEHKGNFLVVAFTQEVAWPPPIVAPTLYNLVYLKMGIFFNGIPSTQWSWSVQNNARFWPAAIGGENFALFSWFDALSLRTHARIGDFSGNTYVSSFPLISSYFNSSFTSIQLQQLWDGYTDPSVDQLLVRIVTTGGANLTSSDLITTIVSFPGADRLDQLDHSVQNNAASLPAYSNSTLASIGPTTQPARLCSTPSILTLSTQSIVEATEIGNKIIVQLLDYTAGGVIRKWQLLPNTSTLHCPSISEGSDGHFIVVWHTEEQNVFGQFFASDGSSSSSSFLISDNESQGTRPSVSWVSNLHYVVAYLSADNTRILARIVKASDGSPQGPSFQVNLATSDWTKSEVSIVRIPDDPRPSFSVLWIATQVSTNYSNIFGQTFVYDISTTALYVKSSAEYALYAGPSGRFLRGLQAQTWSDTANIAVAYEDYPFDPTSYNAVCGRAFSALSLKWLNVLCVPPGIGNKVSRISLDTFNIPNYPSVMLSWLLESASTPGASTVIMQPYATTSNTWTALAPQITRSFPTDDLGFAIAMTLRDDRTTWSRRFALVSLAGDATDALLLTERNQIDLFALPPSLAPYSPRPNDVDDSDDDNTPYHRTSSKWWIAVVVCGVIFGLMVVGFLLPKCLSGPSSASVINSSEETPRSEPPQPLYTPTPGNPSTLPATYHVSTPTPIVVVSPGYQAAGQSNHSENTPPESESSTDDEDRGAGWTPMKTHNQLFRPY